MRLHSPLRSKFKSKTDLRKIARKLGLNIRQKGSHLSLFPLIVTMSMNLISNSHQGLQHTKSR